jgi:hypothetical protein
MKVIASLCFAFLFAAVSPAAEPVSSAATSTPESLVTRAGKVRPDFLLGSFASGLDFTRPGNPPLADFFRRNFNIMTVGILNK